MSNETLALKKAEPEAAPKKNPINKSLLAAKAKAGVIRPDVVLISKGKDFAGSNYAGKRLADIAQERKYGEDIEYHLKNSNFDGCDMRGTDASGILLQGCTFKGAKLQGAIFRGADCRWSDFTGAEWDDETVWDEANLYETVGL